MSEDVWSERDTNPDAIEAALREMLRERHAANQALAPARVLNLVVVVDRSWKGEIANRLERVGRYHASRTILCAVEEGRDTLDAVAVMSYEDSPGGGIGVMRETVEIDMGPEHLSGLETIVDPVVVSELPTVLWCPHGHDDAVARAPRDHRRDPARLRRHARRGRGARARAGGAELRVRCRPRVAAHDAVARAPGRELRPAGAPAVAARSIDGFTIRHQASSTASALLLVGLARVTPALGHPAARVGERRRAARAGLHLELALHRHQARDGRPGGAGTRRDHRDARRLRAVAGPRRGRAPRPGSDRPGTASTPGWCSAPPAARAGSSGEGVRQALLRDPTYGPALGVARGFCAHARSRSRSSTIPRRACSAMLVGVAAGGGHIVLTGGSTPRTAYQEFVDAVRSVGIDVSESTMWFGDERCVPPDDERSNYGLAKASMFDPLADHGLPAIHRMKGELGPDAGAADTSVRCATPGSPRFDLVLLGIGPDGHCASLFPDQASLSERSRLVVGVEEAGLEPFVPRVTHDLPGSRTLGRWCFSSPASRRRMPSRRPSVLRPSRTRTCRPRCWCRWRRRSRCCSTRRRPRV